MSQNQHSESNQAETDPAILYVEDDLLSREIMITLVVEILGIQRLILLEDSNYFEERLASLPYRPDVFLLDIHVLPLDGFQMLELIRHHTDYQDAKVVALTASVMSDEVRKLRTAGFDGVIAKPISQSIFPDLLSRVLQGEQVWHIS
ncbi:MAG: response regulator [Chloroflexi bacterium]|nr:response regulator [Chloroflexota bacterium]